MQVVRLNSPGEGVTGLSPEFFHEKWSLYQSDVPDTKYDVDVPGNVQLALMKAGVVPDLFIGKNNEQGLWIPKKRWDYENRIDLKPWAKKVLDKFPDGGLVHLVFDAIDYDASFYCDNRVICRQTGMFSPVDLTFGITSNLNTAEYMKQIRVHFHKQPWWRTHALKCQMAFGWDFAPEIRTIGLWKDVRIHYTGPAFFTGAYAHATPLEKISPQSTKAQISLAITVQIEDPKALVQNSNKESKSNLDQSYNLQFHVKSQGIDKIIDASVKSNTPIELDLGTTEIPFWEPWSKGHPAIVPIEIKLIWDGQVSDEYHGKVVNQQVRWLRNPGTFPGNINWTLEVNSKKYFLRGINWVPPDSLFGRISTARYEALIQHAIDMNIDILRVWGGGIEEKTAFYDLCDSRGLMIWQEFPFACTNYPKDPRYVEIMDRECQGITQRTRRHPSVIAYCGGNEYNPFINVHIISRLRAAVAKYAPDRFCHEASPYLGDDHNYKMWGARRKLDAYDIDGNGPFQMLTEFGMQAAPNIDTLKQCLSNPNQTDMKQVFTEIGFHKADMSGLNHYANYYGRSFTDIPTLIKTTQMMQAYAYKYAIEVCRSNWPNVSGVFPWQFSDPWPNVSWSVIDYNLRPKMVYKMLQICYAPVLPMMKKWTQAEKQPDIRKANLIIHNATSEPFLGTIQYEIEQKNKIILNSKKSIRVSPERPLKVTELQVEAIPGTIVRMKLYDSNGKMQIHNFSYPIMEPPQSSLDRVRDKLDVRFDSWWRKRMTKLMELERIREENQGWDQKKPIYE